VTELRFAVEV